MKKWLTKDVCSAIFLLLFSVWWLWGASAIKVQSFDNGLAADYMPKLLGWLLVVLSVVQLVLGLLKALKGEVRESDPVPKNHLVMLGLLAALVAYCFAFKPLGFIVCTTLFLFGTTSWLNDPKAGKKDVIFFVKQLVISMVITAMLYLIFGGGVEISLPTLWLQM